MAGTVEIANLQIKIADNSKEASVSVKSLAEALQALKSASKGHNMGSIASNIGKIEKSDFSGLGRLQKALQSAVIPAKSLADSMEKIAKANASIGRISNAVSKTQKQATAPMQEAVETTTERSVTSNNSLNGKTESELRHIFDNVKAINDMFHGMDAKESSSAFRAQIDQWAELQAEAVRAGNVITNTVRGIARAEEDILGRVDLKGALGGWIEEAQKEFGKSHGFIETMKQVGNAAQSVFGSIMPQSLSKTISQFGRLLKMRIMRTIVKNFLAGITEGLQNVYQWAKIMGDGFASTMDGMASSVLYLKNSIGAAFAQILSLVAPHINNLIDIIVEGINYVNMFFATLAGQSTYTRAKKVAVEYGNAVQGAAGGAARAVKELKEELSVLDFDELNQLQDQPEPSSGGGGGGGGGGAANNYADMFEKAEIEANWLTKTAGWIRENFDEVLGIVEAIGAGILAWKISTALAKNITALKDLSLTQKLGITMMVSGFVLEASGAYNLGKNGLNLEDAIMTGVGTALGIAGSVLAFKGPLGLTLSIPLTIAIAVVGYAMGRADRIIKELEEESESWQLSRRIIEESVEGIAKARELYNDTLNSWESNITNTEEKFATGKELLRMFDELASKGDLSSVDLTKLQGIQEAFNNLQLGDGLILEFERLDGAVESNVKEMEKLLEQYRLLALEAGYFQVIQDAYTNIAEATVGLSEANGRKELAGQNATNEIIGLSNMTGIDAQQLLTWIDSAVRGNYSSEEANKALMSTFGLDFLSDDLQSQLYTAIEAYGAYNTAYIEADEFQKVIDLNTKQVEQATRELEKIKFDTGNISDAVKGTVKETVAKGGTGAAIAGVYGTLSSLGGGVPSSATESVEEYTKTIEDLTPAELRQYAAQLAVQNGYSDLVPYIRQGGEEGKKYTQTMIDMFGEMSNGATVVNDSANRNKTYTGTLKVMGDESKKTSSTVVSALSGIIKGVDMATMGRTMADNFTAPFNNLGSNVKSTIETDLNKIGNGMKYSDIMSNISTGLTKAEASTPFSNIGVSIGGNMQSGATSGFNSGTVMTAYQSGLSSKQKSTPFSSVGSAMGGDIQTGTYNGFSSKYIIGAYLQGLTNNQQSTMFSNVGKGMGGDMQTGAWNGFSSKYIIGAYLQGLTSAEYNASFSSIGWAIGDDIKKGIASAIQTINFSTTAAVAGVYRTISGYASTTMYASGGYPQSGELFMANENGIPEMIGSIGGRTAVANNEQIASAIAKALQPMLSGGGTTTTNVMLNMDSRTVARASLKGQRAMNRQYNIVANA